MDSQNHKTIDPDIKKVIVFFRYALVIVGFALLWTVFASRTSYFHSSIIYFGIVMFIPFILLIRIIVFKDKYSFLFVYAFFVSNLILVMYSVLQGVYFLNTGSGENSNLFLGMINLDFCLECGIKDTLQTLPWIALAILVLLTKDIAGNINFSHKGLLIAAFLGLLLGVLQIVFFL